MTKNAEKVPAARTRAPNYRRREKTKDFLCTVPALGFFAAFVYYPIIDLFRISFTNWNLIKDNYKYVALKNYTWLFAGSGTEKDRKSTRLNSSHRL